MTTRLRFLILGVVAGAVGCGRPQSLSGTVTFNGRPLADAAVVLFPQQGGAETVVGATDRDGRFVITPAAGRSIAYGTYKVVVSKRAQLTQAQINASVTPEELLPAKYSDLSKTVLSVTVPTSGELVLELTR